MTISKPTAIGKLMLGEINKYINSKTPKHASIEDTKQSLGYFRVATKPTMLNHSQSNQSPWRPVKRIQG